MRMTEEEREVHDRKVRRQNRWVRVHNWWVRNGHKVGIGLATVVAVAMVVAVHYSGG